MLPTSRLIPTCGLHRRRLLLTGLPLLIALLALSLWGVLQPEQWKRLVVPVAATQPTQSVINHSHQLTKLPATRSLVRTGGVGPYAPTRPQLVFGWWWIVFQSIRDGNWEIYRTNPTGFELTRLTNNSAADTQPRLNRTATRIVFVSERDGNAEIYTMNPDGANQQRLTNHGALDTQPAWSPDGQQIVFVSQRAGNAEIYSMKADGSALRRLTYTAASDLFPSWSSSGQQIAWVQVNGEDSRLWLMNADGSNAHAITGSLRFLQHPVWSLDDTQLAIDYDADGDDFNELALLNVDGSGLKTLLDESQSFNHPLYELWVSGWSPSGDGLAYSKLSYFAEENPKNPRSIPATSDIEGYCFTEFCNAQMFLGSSGQDLLPDIQSRDPLPPTSYVEKLPVYSRENVVVHWTGADLGLSGIYNYDIQYRTDLDSTWHDWKTSTDDTFDEFGFMLPGVEVNHNKVYFRSRALDNAENLEAWPPTNTGDTSTTFFARVIDGNLTDQRGHAMASTPISIFPAPITAARTDSEGYFLARFKAPGEYIVNHSTRVMMGADAHRDFYLPPTTNLLQNGDFEAPNGLAHWSTTGLFPATVVQDNVQAGAASLLLGKACNGLCVTKEITSALDTNPLELVLVADPQNNLHALWRPASPNGIPLRLNYRYRNANGVWSPPSQIYGGIAFDIQAGLTQDGALHTIWQNSGFSTCDAAPGDLLYSQRDLAGNWTTPTSIGTGNRAKLAIAPNGNLYVIYTRCAPGTNRWDLFLKTRLATGSWLPEVTLAGRIGEDYIAIAPDDSSVQVFWVSRSRSRLPAKLFQTIYTPANGRIVTNNIYEAADIARPQAFSTSDHTLHLFWSGAGLLHMQRPTNGDWSSPDLVSSLLPATVVLDAHDTFHLFSTSGNSNDPLTYWYKPAGYAWSPPLKFATTSDYLPGLTASAANTLQGFTSAGAYWATQQVTVSGDSTLSQAVAIPTTAHKPTLAFMYQLAGSVTGKSNFAVRVSDALSTTELFSTTQNTPWTLGWVDLDRWRGQTITVTFSVHQAANDGYLHAYLDDVSVGAWEVPLVKSVSPTHGEVGTGAKLTIQGENFIPTPTMKVGNLALTNVQWLDENTLEAQLPTNLGPGIYDLWITNPGGQTAVYAHAITVGKQLYLPLIEQ